MYNLLEYGEINIVCGINIETKWIMLMMILQVVNHLRIIQNIIGKTPEIPPQPENVGDADFPPQLPVPALNEKIFIAIKYLSNFWRSFHLPLINYEVQLNLLWEKDRVLIEAAPSITEENFIITCTQLFVPIATLLINKNIKFLENLKQGIKGLIYQIFI